jgi:hypothetical protein
MLSKYVNVRHPERGTRRSSGGDNCFCVDGLRHPDGQTYVLLSSRTDNTGLQLSWAAYGKLLEWAKHPGDPNITRAIPGTDLMVRREDDQMHFYLRYDPSRSVGDSITAYEALIDHLASGMVPEVRDERELIDA